MRCVAVEAEVDVFFDGTEAEGMKQVYAGWRMNRAFARTITLARRARGVRSTGAAIRSGVRLHTSL